MNDALSIQFMTDEQNRSIAEQLGVPADRLTALRKAFMDTMTDKEFLYDADQNKFEINPVSGEDLEALVNEVYRTPPEVAKKAAAAVR